MVFGGFKDFSQSFTVLLLGISQSVGLNGVGSEQRVRVPMYDERFQWCLSFFAPGIWSYY